MYCLQYNGDLVVSGSRDGSLRVWEVDDGSCKHVLTGHTDYVLGVKLIEERAVSCSSDNTLRVWDLNIGSCIRVLEVCRLDCK